MPRLRASCQECERNREKNEVDEQRSAYTMSSTKFLIRIQMKLSRQQFCWFTRLVSEPIKTMAEIGLHRIRESFILQKHTEFQVLRHLASVFLPTAQNIFILSNERGSPVKSNPILQDLRLANPMLVVTQVSGSIYLPEKSTTV